MDSSVGVKHDQAKNRWDLFDWEFLDGCAFVLTMGSIKYAPDNWKLVQKWRYIGGLMRHISAYLQGEALDPESGKSHLCHAFCNLMFLFGHDKIQSSGKPANTLDTLPPGYRSL